LEVIAWTQTLTIGNVQNVTRILMGMDILPQWQPYIGVPHGPKVNLGQVLTLEIVSTPLNGFDCDDYNSTINQQKFYYRDVDNDGYWGRGRVVGNERGFWSCTRPDYGKLESELISIEEDCDDRNPLEHPNQFWFSDNDGDHHGHGILAGGQPIPSCTRPPGNWFALSELISVDDCDDYDSLEHPGQFWFLDNDGDRHGGQSIQSCNRPPGNWFAPSELVSISDCDDDNKYIHPGATEYCGGDYNCDGQVNETYCCPTAISYM
jgi:hypothetical protein